MQEFAQGGFVALPLGEIVIHALQGLFEPREGLGGQSLGQTASPAQARLAQFFPEAFRFRRFVSQQAAAQGGKRRQHGGEGHGLLLRRAAEHLKQHSAFVRSIWSGCDGRRLKEIKSARQGRNPGAHQQIVPQAGSPGSGCRRLLGPAGPVQSPWRRGNDMLAVEESQAQVLASVARLAAEECLLRDAAQRVLATDAVADTDLPPFTSSAMDGYALRAWESRGAAAGSPVRLLVTGEVAAGDPGTVP